jgi:nitroreductase
MEIPFARWYPAISARHSRRTFDPHKPVPSEILSSLQKVCDEFRPFPGARAIVITKNAEQIYKFVFGSYGTIQGAGLALAFIGDANNRHMPEEIGYTGEGVLLEATSLGLSTCWMTGTFRPGVIKELVKIKGDERVFAASPVGFTSESKSLLEKVMSGQARSKQRKPLSSMVHGLPENEWLPWTKSAVEAARLAPSAMNRQPWQFTVEAKSITISTDKSKVDKFSSTRLDCGIAMLNLEVAALNQGVKGRWELQEAPAVARFIFP